MKFKFISTNILLVVCLVAILFMLLSTNPQKVGPLGVTIFFSLLYISSFLVVTKLLSRRSVVTEVWLMAFYSAIPVYLLALSSLGQLQPIDLIVLILLTATVTTYHKRRSP